MDKNKLLYFIKDRGYKLDDFCSKLGVSYAAFYGKCRDNRFILSEIWKIKDILELSLEDVKSIFFANYVS